MAGCGQWAAGSAAYQTAYDQWADNLTTAERQAIQDFSEADVYNRVRALQTGQSKGDPALRRLLEQFDSAMASAPAAEQTVYRGMTDLADDAWEALSRLAPGDEMAMNAHTSASSSKAALGKYAKPGLSRNSVSMVIDGKTGVDIAELSAFPSEGEVIMRAGARMRVTSVKVIAETESSFGQIVIHLEELYP